MQGDSIAHHVGINVRDMDAALTFYKEGLGIPEARRWEPGERQGEIDGLSRQSDIDVTETDVQVVYLELRGSYLELVEYRSPSSADYLASTPTNAIGRAHVCFAVDGIGPLYRSLSERFEFLSRPVMSSSGGLMVKCYDPSGNVVEFYEPQELIGGSEVGSIEAIDHVGINVPDLDESIGFYEGVLGWEIRRRYEPTLSVDPFVSDLDPSEAVEEIAFLDTGAFELELLEYPDGERVSLKEHDVGRIHLGVEVDDVEALYEQYGDSMTFLASPQTSPSGTTVVKCRDEHEYTVEFIDPGDWLNEGTAD